MRSYLNPSGTAADEPSVYAVSSYRRASQVPRKGFLPGQCDPVLSALGDFWHGANWTRHVCLT